MVIILKRNSLTFKVFKNTIIMLVFAFFLTYSVMYFLLPSAYKSYLWSQVQSVSDDIVAAYISGDKDKAADIISSTNADGVLDIFIEDEYGTIIYPLSPINKIPFAQPSTPENEPQLLSAEERHFTYNGDEYILKVSTPAKSVDDVRLSMFRLIPIMLFVIIMISISISLFFTNIIVKPILQIHKKANEISNLNFDNGIHVDQDDEIGELSTKLDEMSSKLKGTMSELERDIVIAEQRERERRNYMAMMSHELKTPLTIIKGQSECMINNIGDYKDHNKYLKQSIDIVEDLEGLVSRILLSSKLDNFETKLNLQEVDLQDLITSMIHKYDYLIKTENIDFNIELESASVMVDIPTFELCLKNLVENAVKYCDENGQIEIYMINRTLYIKNNVANASALNPDELFKPFQRGEVSRNSKTGGHGLGLYIIKRTVELHGFQIKMKTGDDFVVMELIMEDFNEEDSNNRG